MKGIRSRRVTTAAVLVVGALASTGSAGAATSKHGVRWTPEQLQQLATAYAEKNPGWDRAAAATGLTPAQKTWTSEALKRLADAYAARNPGWTRP